VRNPELDPLGRVRSTGVRGASLIDLLAVAFSRHEGDVALSEHMARELLLKFGSVRELDNADDPMLTQATGIDGFELVRVRALMEIGRRIGASRPKRKRVIDGPEDVVEVLHEQLEVLKGEKREHFFAVLLDAKGSVMRVANVHIGTLTMSLVGAREVFREAIRDGASSVILGHNHPSGDPTPSPEDIEVTQRLVELGEMLDIRVEDHVILGEEEFKSMRRLRLM
jgi:DNA repair protein RadC